MTSTSVSDGRSVSVCPEVAGDTAHARKALPLLRHIWVGAAVEVKVACPLHAACFLSASAVHLFFNATAPSVSLLGQGKQLQGVEIDVQAFEGHLRQSLKCFFCT